MFTAFVMITLVYIMGGYTPISLMWAFYSPYLIKYIFSPHEIWIYSVVFYFMHGVLIESLPFGFLQKTSVLSLRIVVPTVAVNLCSCIILSFVPISCRNISETDAALYLLIAGIGNELVYAPIHRLLHTKTLYKYHHLHHTQKSPRAIGAVYCGIVEMWIANMTSVFLPLCFTNAPLQLYLIWIICAIQTTQIHHSGKRWPFPWSMSKQPKFHDDHHRLVNINYGNIGFLENALKYITL